MSEEWMNSQAARIHLHRTDRQLRRYVEIGQLRSRRRGRHVEYLRQDIERLAQELPSEAQEPAADLQLIPPSDLLEYISRLQEQLEQYAAREGYLRAQLEARPQLEDTQALRSELAQTSAERDALQRQIGGLQVRYRRSRLFIVALVVILVGVLALLAVAVLSGWTVTVRIGQ
jgi:hypothetical protein